MFLIRQIAKDVFFLFILLAGSHFHVPINVLAKMHKVSNFINNWLKTLFIKILLIYARFGKKKTKNKAVLISEQHLPK